MHPSLSELLLKARDLGRTAAWGAIIDFSRIDERVSSVNAAFTNLVGVNEGYLEWCPNEDPPAPDETLAWLWVVRPDLGDEIASAAANEFFRAVIRRYENNR